MNVIVLDDKRIILESETAIIKHVLKEANVSAFKSAKELLSFAEKNIIDIAFLDINLGKINGINVAMKLQQYNPKVNIIFAQDTLNML